MFKKNDSILELNTDPQQNSTTIIFLSYKMKNKLVCVTKNDIAAF